MHGRATGNSHHAQLGVRFRSTSISDRRLGSRGPTRGRTTLASGEAWLDNLIKPDLVAPGNRIVGVLSTDIFGQRSSWNRLVTSYPQLATVAGASQAPNRTLMELGGTSVAAPVVAGAAALMLQVNPGLTPPLVKAILQYTAQPLPGANLLTVLPPELVT